MRKSCIVFNANISKALDTYHGGSQPTEHKHMYTGVIIIIILVCRFVNMLVNHILIIAKSPIYIPAGLTPLILLI